MTERSAQPSTQRTTTNAADTSASKSTGKSTGKSGGTSAPQPAADRDGEETAVRPPLTERIQAKLSSARNEHVANAEPESNAKATKAASGAKPPRRARLRLTRIDPWSVMKTAFLLSIAFGIVTVVSVAMIWQVLNSAGVWDSINTTIRDVVDSQGNNNFDIRDYVGTDRVLGFTMLVAAVDVILLTAVATLGAFLYNMAAALLGGIEITLAEDN